MSLILSGSDGLSDVDGSATTPAIRGTDANTGIFFPAADTIAFAEGGTECGRFNSSGNLQTLGTISVGNATPSTSGAGITFPATASASSNANTLDDYEEGAWTPTLPNGGTLSVTSARYVKIGQQVTVSFFVSSVAPTNNGSEFRIGGLPFANGYSSGYSGGCFGYVGDSNLDAWLPITGSNDTYIFFHLQTGSGAGRTNAQYLTAASGASDEFVVTITYFAAT